MNMKTIDALSKPCPIPVIEAKKALENQETDSVLVKVDNIVAVQNLEKMANGYGYGYTYTEKAKDSFEVVISKNGKAFPQQETEENTQPQKSKPTGALTVVVGSDRMGSGAEELGKILIKGFIYSLTELPIPPKHVIFLNSGAFLSSTGANTIDDLKKLEEKGTEIITCGTCINYYELQDKLAIGSIVNMYEIVERLTASDNIFNI